MCINLGIDDYNDNFTAMLIEVLRHINYSEPSEEELWESASQSVEIPHIGNIYLEALLNSVQAYCTEHNIDCSYYVNAMDSHLFINGEQVNSFDDFIESTKTDDNSDLSDDEKIIAAAGINIERLDDNNPPEYGFAESSELFSTMSDAIESCLKYILKEVKKQVNYIDDVFWENCQVDEKVQYVKDVFN